MQMNRIGPDGAIIESSLHQVERDREVVKQYPEEYFFVMSQSVYLSFFGGFSARSDDEPVTFTTRKAQALLAYLSVARSTVTREEVGNLLWGDLSDERARHNVRQALAKIRRVFGPIIELKGDGLSLDMTVCNVDIIDFQRLASSRQASSLGQAVSLYEGELLAGSLPREIEFQYWLLRTREQLHNLFVKCWITTPTPCSLASRLMLQFKYWAGV